MDKEWKVERGYKEKRKKKVEKIEMERGLGKEEDIKRREKKERKERNGYILKYR